jgi:hypothetical protein
MEEGQAVSLRIDLEEYWSELERRVRRAVADVTAHPASKAAVPSVEVTGLIDIRRQLAAIIQRLDTTDGRLDRLEGRQILEAPTGKAPAEERLRYLEQDDPEIVDLAREIGVDLENENTVRLLGSKALTMADVSRIMAPLGLEKLENSTVRDWVERRGLPHKVVGEKKTGKVREIRPIDLLRWKAALPGDERFVNKSLATSKSGGTKGRRKTGG